MTMTTPLSGGSYIRDKKTGQRVRVPEDQNPAETVPASDGPATAENEKAGDGERKAK